MKLKLRITLFLSLLALVTISFTNSNKEVSCSEQDKPQVQTARQDRPSGPGVEQSRIYPLAERIGHYDKAKQPEMNSVHGGPGSLNYQTLLGAGTIKDLVFMHCGPINPKSGIGHHFHNNADELFLILDGEAEFTINGRTALIKGPAGVPLKSGNSHAIYNPTNKPVAWLNFQVKLPTIDNPYGSGPRNAYNYSADPGSGAFDLRDGRVGVTLDKLPTFMNTLTMTKNIMSPVYQMNGGKDTLFYRRALGSSAFASNWSFFDHLLIPAGASVGRHYHAGVEEIYLVTRGKGKIRVNHEMAEIVWGDAIPVYAGEIHSIENTSNEPLELMIYGVALEKGKLDEVAVPLTMIKLQMFFEVAPEKCDAFELNYSETYIPALRQQVGYLGSKLIRVYPPDQAKRTGGAASKFNYQMELMFDTEQHRLMWTRTQAHNVAWAKTAALATSYEWRGYDVVGMDQVADPIGPRSLTTEKKY